MVIALTLVLGIVMGIVFGWALEKSRVINPEVIIGQFQLKIFIMLKVFLTAIVTGLCVFSIFFFLGFDRLNWKVFSLGPDVIGGVLLGIGIAIAGACPGTVFAQIGAGYKDSIAMLFGAIAGAIVYAEIKPLLMALIPFQGPAQKITLNQLFGLPFWAIAVPMICCLVSVLLFLEKKYPHEERDLL